VVTLAAGGAAGGTDDDEGDAETDDGRTMIGGDVSGTDDEDAGGDVADRGESTAPAEYQTGFVWRYT
jgi:hypothetical protein